MELREKFEKEKGHNVYAYRQEYAGAKVEEDGFNDDYVEWLESKVKIFSLSSVSSCYAVFDEEDNIVQLYQTEDKANKGMEEFKRSHEHTDFYVDTMQIN